MISKEEIKSVVHNLIEGDMNKEIKAIRLAASDYIAGFKRAHIYVYMNQPSDYIVNFLSDYEESDIYIMPEFADSMNDDITLYSRDEILAPDKRREGFV